MLLWQRYAPCGCSELNFQAGGAHPVWDNGTWTYSLTFTLNDTISATATQLLVFDGVKMAADISLNGKNLGFVTDQVRA